MYFFKRLAMGLSNSAQTFQRVVEHVLNGLEGVFVYLDDIMVFSEEATHDLKLEAIFKHLEDAGLSISLDKCKFLKKKIDYLRYEVSEAGIRPLSKKVEAIKKFPIPTKQKELLHYLGAINYFRASLGQLSTEDGGKPKSVTEILMPLYSLGTCNIAKGTSITDIWKHSPKIRKAVEEATHQCSQPQLSRPKGAPGPHVQRQPLSHGSHIRTVYWPLAYWRWHIRANPSSRTRRNGCHSGGRHWQSNKH